MFVDEARVHASGGKGGDGAVTFHREKYRPLGGPDGGNGGRGGSVVFVADRSVGSLIWLRDHPHQKAKAGVRGEKNNRTGADALDIRIPVPVGTVVIEEATNVMLADLAEEGDEVVVAKGGRGGRGNAAFVGRARRIPGFGELGEPGEERALKVELRSIADVAVIGLPNVGKSTFVRTVSAARPKVADYEFTTLEPTLGVVEIEGDRFTICDIPGLVEGAHEGRGLGVKFLRHVMRAPIYLHLLDAGAARDLVKDHAVVRGELAAFSPEVAEHPELVAISRSDVADEVTLQSHLDHLRSSGIDALLLSSETGDGVQDVLSALHAKVIEARENRGSMRGFELFRTDEEPIRVVSERGAWRVHGTRVERWVAMTDMSNSEAVSYLQERLEKAGVERALGEAGAKHGDEVRISGVEFEWWPAGAGPESQGSAR